MDNQNISSPFNAGPPLEGRLEKRTPSRYAIRRTIRRAELRKIVPIGDTTIYEMEQRGEFPRRFHLSPRCVVWDLIEVEAWVEARKQQSRESAVGRAPGPDVRRRRTRPVKK